MSVQENDDWHDTYRSPELVSRRQAKHAVKLEKLGLLELPITSNILDVCCGQGEMLDVFADKGFSNLTGIDHTPEEKLLKTAVQRKWKYIPASVPEIPFAAETFDCILCAHSLHHLDGEESITKLLTNAFTCLKKGGILAIIDHYNSIHLRAVFASLRSPLALLTPWSRRFREQLIQEHDYLYRYLDRWDDTKRILTKGSGFAEQHWDYDMFFFYYTAKKPVL